MRQLHELREARASRVAEMQGVVAAAEKENRDLSENEAKRFDELKAEIRGLDQQISRAETLAEIERRADAAPVHEGGGFEALERRVSLLNMLRCAVEGRPMQGADAEYSREIERRTGRKAQGFFFPLAALETRVNTTTSVPEVVPVDHRADLFIPLFRRALLIRRLGARIITDLRGDVAIPRAKTGLSVGWVSENEAVPESNLDLDSVGLTPHHVGAVTELSRQLIQQSSPDAEQLVRDDLSAALAEAIDAAAIAGAGGKEPVGILNASGTISASLAGPYSELPLGLYSQVLAMMADVEDRESTGEPGWVLGSRAARVLRGTLRTANGETMLMQGGMVAERPAVASGKVPEGAGVGTAIYGDWTQLLVGVWSELDILVNPYESTAYRRGGVLVRGMATVDVGIRAPQMFAIADNIPAA